MGGVTIRWQDPQGLTTTLLFSYSGTLSFIEV